MALTLTDIYNKLIWKNSPDHTTPINEDNLNHIENGIKNNNTGLRAAEQAINQNTSDIATNTADIEQLTNELTANNQPFRYGYENGKYGYITREGGADTFNPFKSIIKVGTYTNTNSASKTIDCSSLTNYQNLSASDFLIDVKSIKAQSQYGGAPVYGPTSNITKSYNAQTGALTVSGLYASQAYSSSYAWWTSVAVTEFDLYCVN